MLIFRDLEIAKSRTEEAHVQPMNTQKQGVNGVAGTTTPTMLLPRAAAVQPMKAQKQGVSPFGLKVTTVHPLVSQEGLPQNTTAEVPLRRPAEVSAWPLGLPPSAHRALQLGCGAPVTFCCPGPGVRERRCSWVTRYDGVGEGDGLRGRPVKTRRGD